MSSVFVTGTGTGIGKTLISCALVYQRRMKGMPVDAMKPLVSGFDPDAPAGSDPAELLAALGRPIRADTLADVSPYRFRAPLSPDVAAAREGQSLDVDTLTAAVVARTARGPTLVEGVGGLMVPLAGRQTVLDWLRATGLKAVMVCSGALGTLSHTLCAYEALDRAGVESTGLVVSSSGDDPMPLEETIACLRRYLPDETMIPVPRIEGPEPWRHVPNLEILWPTPGDPIV